MNNCATIKKETRGFDASAVHIYVFHIMGFDFANHFHSLLEQKDTACPNTLAATSIFN